MRTCGGQSLRASDRASARAWTRGYARMLACVRPCVRESVRSTLRASCVRVSTTNSYHFDILSSTLLTLDVLE